MPRSEEARKLLTAPSPETYEQVVTEIAEYQYHHLDRILDVTSILSELNLVYILTQAGYKYVPPAKPSVGDETKIQSSLSNAASARNTTGSYSSSNRSSQYATGSTSYNSNSMNSARSANADQQTTAGSANSERSAKLLLQQHLKAAENCIKQSQWSAALKELRSAQRIDEANSRAHALLGVVYMNQKLASMAKSSFLKALKLNPNETIALENINKIGKASTKSTTKSSSTQSTKTATTKQQNKGWSWNFWKR
jgi:tetratricopeptide (TPR) repeat protein